MDSTQKAVKNQEICEPLQGNLGITQSSGLDGHEMPVFYSLGNFLSHQVEPQNMLGGLASVTFEKDAASRGREIALPESKIQIR